MWQRCHVSNVAADTLSAREAFAAKVKEVKGDSNAAKLLGCCRSFVFMIRKGQRKPGRYLELTIEKEFGIAPARWLDSKKVKRAVSKIAARKLKTA